MRIHLGSGARFVEVEVSDGSFALGVIREFVIGLYDHLDEPYVESGGVGFSAERGDGSELSRPDHPGSRGRGFVVRDGHR